MVNVATIVTYGGGLRRVAFSLTPNGPRRCVRLGRVSMKHAEAVKARVESIVSDKLLGRPHDAEVSAWLAGLDEKLLGRLRAAGLADGVGLADATLAAFLERFKAALTSKPASAVFYTHTGRNLTDYFGADKRLRDIGTADADAWRAWLVTDQKLAAATVARRVIAARTIWRKALRWRLAAENPFAGVRGGHQANEARKRFIPAATVEAVIDAAPNAEWRAIIALARYGGLRVPSETNALRWVDIDWERGTIRVTVPKLAHFEHLATRTIPLFPELRDRLLTLFEQAPEGAEYVVTGHRLASLNLRKQIGRIIERAGVKPWPKPWHNMRASRETELMREYDLATVCRWIGNSPAVAAKHYATSVDLDADFRRAAGLAEPTPADANAGAPKGAPKCAPVGGGTGATASDSRGDGFTDSAENAGKSARSPSGAVPVEMPGMGVTGFEPVTSCVSSMRSSQLS